MQNLHYTKLALYNFALCRGRWGNAVMRGKAVFCHYRKTKNGKELLLSQQLHLTIKQIGTKNGQYDFS